MPISTTTQIIIDLTGSANRPQPPSQPIANRTVDLRKLSPAASVAFALRVSTDDSTGERRLPAVEAEQLAVLLAQLPAHSMDAQTMSFDGVTYNLTIVRANEFLSFHWQNDNWRFSPSDSRNKWESVAALADFVLSLAEKKGAS